MNFFFLILGIVLQVIAYEPKEYGFSENTPVTLLDQENFDRITRIIDLKTRIPGYQQEAWFIFFYGWWCPACPRLVPIWEELAKSYSDQANFGALNATLYPELAERFALEMLPQLLYFAPNNRMYRFDGTKTIEELTDYVVNDKWQLKIEEGEIIPHEVDQFKKWMRRVFHPFMIPVIIVILFIIMISLFIIEQKKIQKDRMEEAREVKKLLIKRAEFERLKKQQIEDEKQSLLKRSKID